MPDGSAGDGQFYEPRVDPFNKTSPSKEVVINKLTGTCSSNMFCVVQMHYENTSMQNTAIFQCCKNDNFLVKLFDYFHIFAHNMYCGYTLEPPH